MGEASQAAGVIQSIRDAVSVVGEAHARIGLITAEQHELTAALRARFAS